MSDYPNREHENADKAARRRALKALETIKDEVQILSGTLALGSTARIDADAAQTIAGKVRDLAGYLAELGTLYDVREWDAIDRTDMVKAFSFSVGDAVTIAGYDGVSDILGHTYNPAAGVRILVRIPGMTEVLPFSPDSLTRAGNTRD